MLRRSLKAKQNEQKAAELEKERNQNLVDYLKRRDVETKQFEEREAKKLQNWLNDRQNDWQGKHFVSLDMQETILPMTLKRLTT